MDSVRFLLRLVISLNLNLPMNNPWSRTVEDLMSHTDEIKADPDRSAQFTKVAYTLSEYAGKTVTLPDLHGLLKLYGKIVINSYTIYDGELRDLGHGIYLSSSKLNHSCRPNAVATYHGVKLVVKAVRDIPDGTHDKVFITYINQMSPLEDRQEALGKQYYFQCACEKCNDKEIIENEISFCCPNSQCCGAVSLNKNRVFGSCRLCGKSDFPANLRDRALAVLDACKTRLGQIEEERKDNKWKEMLDGCEDLLRKSAGILHANNIYLVGVLDGAFCAAIYVKEYELAAKYGARTLDPYRLYYGDNSWNVALHLFTVGRMQLQLKDRTKALKLLKMSRKILAVTHGTEHKIYKRGALTEERCREELRIDSILKPGAVFTNLDFLYLQNVSTPPTENK